MIERVGYRRHWGPAGSRPGSGELDGGGLVEIGVQRGDQRLARRLGRPDPEHADGDDGRGGEGGDAAHRQGEREAAAPGSAFMNSYAEQGGRVVSMATASIPGFGNAREELVVLLERG